MTGPIVSRGRSLRELIPAAYLLRDADGQGGNGMLGALLDLLDAEIASVEDELARRYASLFVETCADADLAHFQALLGVSQLPGDQHPRALIGNIIGYRRGKGTIATLERVAAAASGWGAHAVDYFRLLGGTQTVKHFRAGATTVPLRAPGALAWADSPFDLLAHTVDVRTRGRYNIPDVAVHLWRLDPATTLEPSDAIAAADPLRYRFHPLGIDAPLYSIGRSLDAMSALSAVTAADITEPIKMSQLRDALDDYYGEAAEQSICVLEDGVAIPVAQVSVRALDDRVSGAWGSAPPATRVAVDPVRGRLAFAAAPQGTVSVRFVRARPMEIGSRDVADSTPPTVKISVGGPLTLAAAVTALPAAGGVIELAGSGRHAPGAPLAVAGGASVTIRASTGNWPVLVTAGVTINCAAGARLTLTGLLITSGPLVITGSPAAITLDRCTLVAGGALLPDGRPAATDTPSLVLDLDGDAGTAVHLSGCLTGPVRLAAPDAALTMADCVLAGAADTGSAHAEPVLVGARLTPFPAWPDGAAGLRLQVGVVVELDLRLAITPTTVDEAAEAIRSALAFMALTPDVSAAVDVTTIEVAVHDGRLVLAAPGSGELSAIDASDTDNAAALLGLTGSAGAYSAWSLLGDPVPEAPVLRVLPAHLGVELGAPGLLAEPVDVALASQPASLAEAAGALQAALPTHGGSPFVLVTEHRLRVVPGVQGWAVRFVDGAAARALGLNGTAPVLAGSSDGLIPAPSLTADRTTVLGAVHVARADVSDSIVTGALVVERRQVGCLRYSYVGVGSQTPRRYQCVGPETAGPPRFTSLRFGAAGFVQLTPSCPPVIARGGEDGSEMGAFAAVRAPLRLAAVASVLAEYLRLTAAGSIFLES